MQLRSDSICSALTRLCGEVRIATRGCVYIWSQPSKNDRLAKLRVHMLCSWMPYLQLQLPAPGVWNASEREIPSRTRFLYDFAYVTWWFVGGFQ